MYPKDSPAAKWRSTLLGSLTLSLSALTISMPKSVMPMVAMLPSILQYSSPVYFVSFHFDFEFDFVLQRRCGMGGRGINVEKW
jgi:hypothetical protein